MESRLRAEALEDPSRRSEFLPRPCTFAGPAQARPVSQSSAGGLEGVRCPLVELQRLLETGFQFARPGQEPAAAGGAGQRPRLPLRRCLRNEIASDPGGVLVAAEA